MDDVCCCCQGSACASTNFVRSKARAHGAGHQAYSTTAARLQHNNTGQQLGVSPFRQTKPHLQTAPPPAPRRVVGRVVLYHLLSHTANYGVMSWCVRSYSLRDLQTRAEWSTGSPLDSRRRLRTSRVQQVQVPCVALHAQRMRCGTRSVRRMARSLTSPARTSAYRYASRCRTGSSY